ncbi:MAG: hypothetical protein KIT84_14155 [Labilithrix sp.]|nr:hypothetical protein [Labilithrix sp.]MCW5812164.1 hypothetical protein [Labilithrix sp.]
MSSSSSKLLFLILPGVLFAGCDDPKPPPVDDSKVVRLVSEGCNTTALGAPKGFFAQTQVEIGSSTRTYDWMIPEAHNGQAPIPLVFVFGGDLQKGADARAKYPLEAATAGAAAFVWPDPDTSGRWDIERGGEGNGDVALYDAIRTSLGKSHCIDINRVFVTGHSRGAYFANHLGCFRGGSIRALAAHGGGGPTSEDALDFSERGQLNCPEKPVAAIITHGADDTEVELKEGQATRDHWGRVNSCRTGGLEGFDPAPCIQLLNCASDRPVVYCEVPGIGHDLWSLAPRATWSFFDSL